MSGNWQMRLGAGDPRPPLASCGPGYGRPTRCPGAEAAAGCVGGHFGSSGLLVLPEGVRCGPAGRGRSRAVGKERAVAAETLRTPDGFPEFRQRCTSCRGKICPASFHLIPSPPEFPAAPLPFLATCPYQPPCRMQKLFFPLPPSVFIRLLHLGSFWTFGGVF